MVWGVTVLCPDDCVRDGPFKKDTLFVLEDIRQGCLQRRFYHFMFPSRRRRDSKNGDDSSLTFFFYIPLVSLTKYILTNNCRGEISSVIHISGSTQSLTSGTFE